MDYSSSFKMLAPIHKSFDSEGKKFYLGVASSTSIDRDNERMTKSVLTKASKELVGKPVLFNHDNKGEKSLALGGITDSWLEGDRLMIKWFPSEAQSVKDALTQVEEGILGWMSVGGKAMNKSYASDFDGQDITDASFYEVSAVYVPANPDAKILGAMTKMLNSLNKDHAPVGSLEEVKEELAHKCPSCGHVAKSRFATAWNDDNAQGKKPAEEEMAPVVPKKKKKTKDGEVVDDEVYDRARAKGEAKGEDMDTQKEEATELVKENGPMTPNAPQTLGGDVPPYLASQMAEIKMLLGKIQHENAQILSSLNTRGGSPQLPPMPSEHKSAEVVDLQKSLEAKIAEADASAKPAGLVVAEVAKSESVEFEEESLVVKGAYKV